MTRELGVKLPMAMAPMPRLDGLPLGCPDIDRRLGGGLPWGALTLIEGPHAAGKTVLCQHLTHSALRASQDAGQKVAYYSSDLEAPSLISRMATLGLDALDDFLLDRLRIYPLALTERCPQPNQLLGVILRHVAALPDSAGLVVIDSLSGLLALEDSSLTGNFFSACAALCRQGRTIVATLDNRQMPSYALTLARQQAQLCLRLSNQVMLVEQVVKVLEVTDGGPSGASGNPLCFDVAEGQGIRALPAARMPPRRC